MRRRLVAGAPLRRRAVPWRNALSLFTVIPVRGTGELTKEDAARAVLWMPGVGLLLGLLGAAVLLAVGATGTSLHGPDDLRRLLAAALALGLTALLTGALHLDGLADTADGLGSRRPRATALAIMRKSDIGPMGVAALVLSLLIQVTALAAVPGVAGPSLAFVLSQVTARVAVVQATASPPARPGGFGALVASGTSGRGRVISVAVFGCAVVAVGVGLGLGSGSGSGSGFGGWILAVRGLVAAAVGLLAGTAVRFLAVRRLGGTTGDVFGAIVEVTATVTLVTCALLA